MKSRFVCALSWGALAGAAAAQPAFEFLPDPVPLTSPWRLQAVGLSDDGSAIAVADTWARPAPRALVWRRGEGFTEITSPGAYVEARAMSADGRVVGGRLLTTYPQSAAFLLRDGVVEPLPGLTTNPDDQAAVNALNADGSVAVGVSVVANFFHAARWDDGAPTDLGRSFGAEGVSRNGSIVAGTTFDANLGVEVAWRLDAGVETRITGVPGLPPGAATLVYGLSPEGSVAFGEAGYHGPFVWRDGRVELTGLPPGPWEFGAATAASRRGEVVVGWVVPAAKFPPETGAVWTEATGPALASELIADRFGVDLSTYGSFMVNQVSPDGRTLIGSASEAFDGRDALIWRAHLPVRWFAACRADVDGDGVLNFFDLSAFLADFAAGSTDADFAFDGVLNFFDVSAYLALFTDGCQAP